MNSNMIFSEYSEDLRNGYMEMFRNSSPRYHLTLTFKYRVNQRVAENLLNKFMVFLNRAILKGRYKRNGEALIAFVVKEPTPAMENSHFHIIISDPEWKLPKTKRMTRIIGKKIENLNRTVKSVNQINRHMLQEYYEGDEESNLEKYLTKIFERPGLTDQERMNAIAPLGVAPVSFF